MLAVGVGVAFAFFALGLDAFAAELTGLAAVLALGAVAPTVVRVPDAEAALVGNIADDETLSAVADAASEACNPIDDKRGTVAYRKQVAGVLAKRAVLIAIERAEQRNGTK